jgi:hypothetical protein
MITAMLFLAVLFAVFGLVKPRAGCTHACGGDGRCGKSECPNDRS